MRQLSKHFQLLNDLIYKTNNDSYSIATLRGAYISDTRESNEVVFGFGGSVVFTAPAYEIKKCQIKR